MSPSNQLDGLIIFSLYSGDMITLVSGVTISGGGSGANDSFSESELVLLDFSILEVPHEVSNIKDKITNAR